MKVTKTRIGINAILSPFPSCSVFFLQDNTEGLLKNDRHHKWLSTQKLAFYKWWVGVEKGEKKYYWLNVQTVVNVEYLISKSSFKDVYQCVILPVPSHSPPLSCSTKQYSDQAVNSGLRKVLHLWRSGFYYTRAQCLMYSCSGVLQFSIKCVRMCMYTLKL